MSDLEKPFDPARPRYTLPFAGEEYDLIGTLEMVESIEWAFKEGILHLTARCVEMGLSDTAKLLAAMLKASGHKVTPREVAEKLLNAVGVASDEFQLLQAHLYTFLRVLLEPPEARQAMASRLGERMGKWLWQVETASPGKTTSKSV